MNRKSTTPHNPTSSAYCRAVTKQASSTFYLAGRLFDRQTRADIWAVYAFCRTCDDVADTAANKSQAKRFLASRRQILKSRAYSTEDLVWPELFRVIDTYQIPLRYFNELIDGIEGDIIFQQPRNEGELYRYSYLVAGTVGLICAYVLGATKPVALRGAEQLGVAMQITNILRDIAPDLRMHRSYLPAIYLQQAHLTTAQVAANPPDPAAKILMARLVALADRYYDQAIPALEHMSRRNRRAVRCALELYRAILRRIETLDYNVGKGRARLNAIQKFLLVSRVYLTTR